MSWKDEFRTLLLGQTRESFRRAIDLKDENAPESLFKFFRPDEWAFENLSEETVFLASPEQFNDPYDSGLTMDNIPMMVTLTESHQGPEFEELGKFGLTKDDFSDLLRGQLSSTAIGKLKEASPEVDPREMERFVQVFPEIVRQVNQKWVDERFQPFFQKGLKITCFSERADSLLLWAHYAQQHKGFCVEYGYRDLPKTAVQRRLLFPVLYESSRVDLGSAMHQFMLGTPDLVPIHAIVAALHKSPDWSYENEWRIVNPDGRDEGFPVRMVKPRAVHAGIKMAHETRQRLEAICLSRNIPLLTPTLSSTEYRLVLANESRPSA